MTEFIRLPGRILNLSQIREISFEHCTTTIHWQDGHVVQLTDIDAAILLDVLERHYGLLTDPAAQWWELEPENDSDHRERSHSFDNLPQKEVIAP